MYLKKEIIILFLFALVAMLLPFAYYDYQTSDDGWQHIQKAECYLDNGGFPVKALYSLEVEDCISYQNYPPVFSLLLSFGQWFGGIHFFARLLPSILGALTVLVIYNLALKFVNEKQALVAAALAVFTPEFMILSSTNTQPQILGIIFSLLCFNYLLELFDSRYNKNEQENYKKNFVLIIIFSALIIYTYTTYVLFPYAAIGISALLRKKYSFLKDLVLLTIFTTVLSLPILIKYYLFIPPNAGFSYSQLFDSYAMLLPIRIGLPLLILAFFSQFNKQKKQMLFPLLVLLALASIYWFMAPLPPARNLVFLIFPLAIIAANGWPRFVALVEKLLKLKNTYTILTILLIIASAASGALSTWYFIQQESITPEEYEASQWLNEHPGKIATYNWGIFNYDAELQYNHADLLTDPETIIKTENIKYVLLYSKTPEQYAISNQEASTILQEYCDISFERTGVKIFDCSRSLS